MIVALVLTLALSMGLLVAMGVRRSDRHGRVAARQRDLLVLPHRIADLERDVARPIEDVIRDAEQRAIREREPTDVEKLAEQFRRAFAHGGPIVGSGARASQPDRDPRVQPVSWREATMSLQRVLTYGHRCTHCEWQVDSTGDGYCTATVSRYCTNHGPGHASS